MGMYRNVDTTIPLFQQLQQELRVGSSSNNDDGSSSFQVHLLNHHSEGNYNSITTQLYCEDGIVNVTHHTCEFSRQHRQPLIAHKGVSLEPMAYDRIVVAAYQAGLLNAITTTTTTNVTRLQARLDLQQYHAGTLNKTIVDLPRLCPPKEQLQVLLDRSLDLERRVMSHGEYATNHRQEHTDAFWKAATVQKKYCWVDVDRLLEDATSWQQVLDERLTRDEWDDVVWDGTN